MKIRGIIMKPIFFKELKSYTIEYLSKKLEIDNEYMDELIKNLIERKLISKNKIGRAHV